MFPPEIQLLVHGGLPCFGVSILVLVSFAREFENENAAATPAYADVRNNTVRGGTSATLAAGVAGAGSSPVTQRHLVSTALGVNGIAWGVMVADHLDINANTINVGNVGTKVPGNRRRRCAVRVVRVGAVRKDPTPPLGVSLTATARRKRC